MATKTKGKLKKRLYELVWVRDTDMIELLLAAIMLVIGLAILVMPAERFEETGVYRVVRQLAPQYVWAVIMMVSGAVAVFGSLFEFNEIRRWTAFGKTAIWVIWLVSFLFVGFITPTAIFLLALILSSAWVYLRMTKDRG